MLRKVFDLNRTVRHVPYREMRAKFERDRRRSEWFFLFLFRVAMIGMGISLLVWLVQI